MKDVSCPYCGHDQDINHDDGYGYSEDQTYKQNCEVCDMVFVFNTSIIYSYEVEKADCLNELKPHEFKPTHSFPKIYTEMECAICGERRKPTEDEFKSILSE